MPNASVKLPLFLLLCVPACRPLAGAPAAPRTEAVDTSYYVTLGGVRQYVEIRGASSDLLVLLYLHGRPCLPATPLLRYHQAELSESFIVVSWDQRGCGHSAEIDPTSGDMTLERHVLDAHELTAHLKDTLRKQRVLLIGHSRGSVLGWSWHSDSRTTTWPTSGSGRW